MPARPERERAHLHAKSARAGLEEPVAGSSHAHGLELKRLKGEIPCAECKRLKIKCDRQIPCASCVRRGCAQLCPNDHLSTGDGTRFASAAEDILRRRIQRMLGRVRALEDALHNEQAIVSDAPHELLHDGDFAQKFLDEMDAADGGSITIPGMPNQVKVKVEELQLDAVSEAFGTLSIARDGSSRFFGRTAGPTILLTGGAPNAPLTLSSPSPPEATSAAPAPGPIDTAFSTAGATINPEADPALPSHHAHANPAAARESTSTYAPDSSLRINTVDLDPPPDQILLNLRKHLPSKEETDKLLLAYFERGTWLVRGPTRLQILNELVPAIYAPDADARAAESTKFPHDKAGDCSAHAHALLFATFGVSFLVKEGGADWETADEWMRRAQAALVVRSVLDGPSLLTLQALHALAVLMLMRQDGRDELAWSYEAMACQLSLTMGLHRDVSNSEFTEGQIENRRQIFWHLFHLEGWNALNTGRPTVYQQSTIDCPLPNQFEMFVDGTPIQTPSVMRHSFTFFLRIITNIIHITIAARPPRFREVMDIDREIDAFPLAAPGAPPELKHLARPGNVLYFYVGYPVKDIALICLHRTFFAQALLDATAGSAGAEGRVIEPEKGPHAHSFRRMVAASHGVLAWALEQYSLVPEFCAAAWYTWTYAFAGALVLGSVVVRAPRHEMAQKAFHVVERAIGMFESAAAAGAGRAQHGLPILKGIYIKAVEAMSTGIPAHVRNSAAAAAAASTSVSSAASPDSQGSSTGQTDVEEDDAPEDTALKIFGGRNKFVHNRAPPRPSTASTTATRSTGQGRPGTGSTGVGAGSPAATHGSESVGAGSPAAATQGSGSERARSGTPPPFAWTAPPESNTHAQMPAHVFTHEQQQQYQQQQHQPQFHPHVEQHQYATEPTPVEAVPQATQYYPPGYEHDYGGGAYAQDDQYQRSISSGSGTYQPEYQPAPSNVSYSQEQTYVSPPLSTVHSDSSYYVATTSRPSTGRAEPPQEHTSAYPMHTYGQRILQEQQPYQPTYDYALPGQEANTQYTSTDSTRYMEQARSKLTESTAAHHTTPHILNAGGTWYNQRSTQPYTTEQLTPISYDSHAHTHSASSGYMQPQQYTSAYPTISPPEPISRNASYGSSIHTHIHMPEQRGYPSNQTIESTHYTYTPTEPQYAQDQNVYAQYSNDGYALPLPPDPMVGSTSQPTTGYASIVGFASFTGSAAHKAQDQRAFDTSWAPWVSALADPTLGGAQQYQQQPQQEAVYTQSYGSWIPSH